MIKPIFLFEYITSSEMQVRSASWTVQIIMEYKHKEREIYISIGMKKRIKYNII